MAGFKEGDKVGFQFGSTYCIGTIVRMLTPARAEVLVPEGTETTDQLYEIDVVNLLKEE